MEPLRTLVAANLHRDKATFAGLFALLFLAACALAFTISLYCNLSERAATCYEEAGGGDVWLISSAEGADALLSAIAETDEVAEVRETPAFSAPMRFEGPDKEPKSDLQLFASLFEPWGAGLQVNILSDDLDGYEVDLAAPKPGEVYVTPSAKVLHEVRTGDKVMLEFGNEQRWLTVAGFFEDPQIGAPFISTKRYLVAPETFDGLYALAEATYTSAQAAAAGDAKAALAQGAYPVLEIDAFLTPAARADGIDGPALASIIQQDANAGANETNVHSKETLLGFEGMVTQVVTTLLAVFALLLFAIALVMCIHAVSTSIAEDYADWGIAKAVGLSSRTLKHALILQYALIGSVGIVGGFALGVVLEPLAWPPFLLVTGTLVREAALPWGALLCLGLLFGLLLAAVAFKARKLSLITPLMALRRGEADVSFSPHATCAVGGSHLEASLAWRSLVSQKRQYVGMFACSLLLCAFITLCFGIGGAVAEDDATYQALGMWRSDVSAALVTDNVTFDEVEAAIEEVAPIKRSWTESALTLNHEGEAHTFVGLSDFDLLGAQAFVEGQAPRLANEVACGANFARRQHLAVGDELVVTNAAGDAHTLLVSGIVSSALDGGTGMFLTIDGLEDLAGKDAVDVTKSRQYQLADHDDAADALAHAEARFGNAVSFDPSGLFGMDDVILLVRDIMVRMGYSMTAFAALLACVAVALVSRRMLSRERHDLGIYRALGFRVRRLRLSFALRFLGVALLGSTAGAALVMAVGSSVVGSLFGLFGARAFALELPVWLAILLSVGLAVVFALSAYAFSRSIRTISVRELVTE